MAVGKFKWPNWADHFLSSEDALKVSEAVEKAEAQTSGEIVPIIVRRSSTIAHVPWLVTLVLLLIFLVFEIPQVEFFRRWNAYWLLLIISAASYALSLLLTRSVWIQRIFVPQSDQAFQVEARALLEFYQAGIQKTKAKTGVLLFISLMERKAVILADEEISKKLPRETWSQICAEMVHGISRGETVAGLVTAIQRSGELLSQHFPTTGKNANELSNQLILKE